MDSRQRVRYLRSGLPSHDPEEDLLVQFHSPLPDWRPDRAPRPWLDLDRFNEFGFFLGAAFQIQDDVLNLVGSRERYGKEIGGDLYEGNGP